jgi:hypothetical protein
MEGWRCACFAAQVCSLTGGHTLRPVGNEVTGSPVSVSAREFHSAVTREGYSAHRFFLLQIKMALPDIGNLHFVISLIRWPASHFSNMARCK